MEVIRRKPKKEVAPGKKRRGVLTYLDDADWAKLRALVKLGNSNNSEVMRDSLRHAYKEEMGDEPRGSAS